MMVVLQRLRGAVSIVVGPPGWMRVLVLALATVALATFSAAVPYVDLPPGDYYSPTVHNDTANAVQIGECADDAACTHVLDATSRVLAPNASTTAMQANARGGTQLMVSAVPSRLRLGCLIPDSDAKGEVHSPRRLEVSAAGQCGVTLAAAPSWVLPTFLVWVVSAVTLVALVILRHRRSRALTRAASASA
jgi:hypothetical protein